MSVMCELLQKETGYDVPSSAMNSQSCYAASPVIRPNSPEISSPSGRSAVTVMMSSSPPHLE